MFLMNSTKPVYFMQAENDKFMSKNAAEPLTGYNLSQCFPTKARSLCIWKEA